eukprot:s1301_g6.t1
MTAMENRALMWQADLDQELQRLNAEISQVLHDTPSSAPSPPAEQLALWRKELRQTQQFLVETLKLLTEKKNSETLLGKMRWSLDASALTHPFDPARQESIECSKAMKTTEESWLASQQRAFSLNGLALEPPSAVLRSRHPQALQGSKDKLLDLPKRLKQGQKTMKTKATKAVKTHEVIFQVEDTEP